MNPPASSPRARRLLAGAAVVLAAAVSAGAAAEPVDSGASPSEGGSNRAPEAASGYRIYGIPGWSRQADVLRPIAPVLSARDDTFTIRAYGDCRDASGINVKARAVCEATIRRSRDYVDPTDEADAFSTTSGTVPAKTRVNETFGRQFEMISFRWLSPGEI